MEHFPSRKGQQESELAHFLSTLREDERRCHGLHFDRNLKVRISFGRFDFTLVHGTSGFHEFLEGVASSEIVFPEKVSIILLTDDSCKYVEAFADALRQSRNRFRGLNLHCQYGSAVPFAKCVASVLLKNDAIQDLRLRFDGVEEEISKEFAAEFMAIIGVPHNLRILKAFRMDAPKLDGEGMEQLVKPFGDPLSVLEEFEFYSLTSDAQLEHVSGMLASSTSLKTLVLLNDSFGKGFTRGYISIADALCSNQSLEALFCEISSSMELKVLLDPLMPKNNHLQRKTTLTTLRLFESLGGKEGIETLVDLIHTNTSLLELGLKFVDDLSYHDTQGIENVLAVLEALKINKSLKRIDFRRCEAVGGYKVLGAMMDLLLENHNIEDIV